MVSKENRDKGNLPSKFNDNQPNAQLHYLSGLTSSNTSRLLPTASRDDDLIRSLSSSYENRRARQVSEWEKLGQTSVRTQA